MINILDKDGNFYLENDGKIVTPSYEYIKDDKNAYICVKGSGLSNKTEVYNKNGELIIILDEKPRHFSSYECHRYDVNARNEIFITVKHFYSSLLFGDKTNMIFYNYKGVCVNKLIFPNVMDNDYPNMRVVNFDYKTKTAKFTDNIFNYYVDLENGTLLKNELISNNVELSK